MTAEPIEQPTVRAEDADDARVREVTDRLVRAHQAVQEADAARGRLVVDLALRRSNRDIARALAAAVDEHPDVTADMRARIGVSEGYVRSTLKLARAAAAR